MKRTVALLVESSRAYGRGLLRGIAQYVRATGGWRVLHDERGIGDQMPDWFKAGQYDGIIARVEHASVAELIARLGRPAIDVRGHRPVPGVPVVGTDNRMTVEMALDHLRQRGFRHLAFCGFGGVDFSAERAALFTAAVNRMNLEAHVYQSPSRPGELDTPAIESQAIAAHAELTAWLCDLPRPVGVLACNDVRGRQVLDACRACGVRVPEELAVIGVDNDDVYCELSDPPLSSVIPACERIGYEAAAMLDRMMNGSTAVPASLDIPPLGVVTRQSTDTLAVDDAQVAAALRYIRDQVSRGITAEDVLDHLAEDGPGGAVSRTTLDRRFSAYLGRSIKEEILRARIARIKDLLQDTRYSLATVAGMVGIQHPEQLSTLFKRETGETPGEYRKRTRVPHSGPNPT